MGLIRTKSDEFSTRFCDDSIKGGTIADQFLVDYSRRQVSHADIKLFMSRLVR
jgi:hypothetical protein